VGVIALAGCSLQPTSLPEGPATELSGVPFFPQTVHECGPAALATVLNYSAAPATPEELAHEVYIPGRQGSLQIEMLAATRRHGRLPYVIEPHLDTLRAELAAGLPILVLQDLGALWIHRWHYAVVVGYEPATDMLILRSGTERRRLESVDRFIYSWERAGRWGMLVLPAGVLPATATPDRYVKALNDAAGRIPAGDVTVDFDAAVLRWGDSPVLLFAAANNAYASGDLANAETLYRRLLALDPDQVAARNNLATLLLDRGCITAGQREAALALNSAVPTSPFLEALRDTNQRAQALTADREPAECQ
jgi:hypothetical protein